MIASRKPTRALGDAACRSGRPAAASGSRHPDLVIENLAEFATAGVAGVCASSFADFIAREPQPSA